MIRNDWLRNIRPRQVGGRVRRRLAWRAAIAAAALASGCTSADGWRLWNRDRDGAVYHGEPVARVPYAPPVTAIVSDDPSPQAAPPLTVRNIDEVEYRDVSLDEAMRFAMNNSKVMRDLGATVLANPEGVRTRFITASQYTDPRFGPEAALAAFDAEFATRAFFENNDRVINNRFFGGGTTEFQQDLNVYQTEIRKRAATGTLFSVRNNTEYDANNAPANIFPSAWNTNVEAEARQPLLQGGGVDFNRIAGPDAIPGVYNGVVIARVNNEISQADFELALRDFVSDVSNAYWELYFAYRDLDAKKKARDEAYDVWQRYQARYDADEERGAGTATDRVALAREQYYRFEREVQEALAGRPFPGTQTDPGAGALRGTGGVLTAERRLRLLMGWPINDRSLLRPVSEPQGAEVVYDWSAVVSEAVARRTELRRQKLLVKRREMELTAAKNFLSPRLDAVALYRWRGFGHDLLGYDDPRFGNAVENLTGGDYQEWQVGVELAVPIGFRRGHAAVQNAELLVARERAVLHEQERQVVHDLSNAVGEKDRAFQAAITSLDRLTAANVLLESLKVLDRESAGGGGEAVSVNLDRLLDAQRRVAEAESEFYRALAAYEVALKNVNFEKGSLLDYHDVLLAEAGENRSSQLVPFGGVAPAGGAVPPAPATGEVQPGFDSGGIPMADPMPQTAPDPAYDPAEELPPADQPIAPDALGPADGAQLDPAFGPEESYEAQVGVNVGPGAYGPFDEPLYEISPAR